MFRTMHDIVQWVVRRLKRATKMIIKLKCKNRELENEIANLKQEIHELKQEVEILKAADRLTPLVTL
jgi:predicted RNase H-like nuclease (RuvC/YqgF family)